MFKTVWPYKFESLGLNCFVDLTMSGMIIKLLSVKFNAQKGKMRAFVLY